ncbi:U3 small nucleolar RNA-associated protein 14 homolog A [Planococcus citri]|uniref:U3 small nucleolar RNA-associated protein 14 homolog A n=1 Tax=Planococcus citri TaxID=170843 RepID=UPI0031F77B04
MGRKKNKPNKGKNEDKVKMLQEDENSDEEISDQAHGKLLESIKQVHGKPKIVPATRSEPAAEVSEFAFSSRKDDAGDSQRHLEKDLVQAIKKKNRKVARELESAKSSRTLAKPLESVHEKKIQREIGFENVRKQLNRWDDVVKTNRLADQLVFPLNQNKVQVYDHSAEDLFSSLPNPTPLEKELAQVLNSSKIAKQHEEKLQKSKFRLTLKEMIEKRKMFAKVRAQASYKIAKAWRQNKIKSKKYHRILRREKTKQQMKDFEELQKTDPEAAMKQLELLEKSRAEERATLRHRNTGKWAKNQIIKATYNKESRVALSEQLQKNRELTEKKHIEESASESDTEDESTPATKKDPNNPWIADNSNEYAQFVTNYKKFWEEKSSTEPKPEEDTFEDNFTNNDTEDKSSGIESTLEQSVEQEKKTSKKRKSSLKNDNEEKSKKVEFVEQEKNTKKRKGSPKNKQTSKKVKTVAQIVNRSGSWTVTENESEPEHDDLSEPEPDEPSKPQNKTDKSAEKRKNRKHVENLDSARPLITDQDFVQLGADLRGNKEKVEPAKKSDTDENIDPNKYLKVNAKRLMTELPEIITGGDEGIDDEEEDFQHRMTIGEAFADDDVVAEFEEEKQQAIDESLPKEVDLTLPGWGSWTSGTIQEKEAKRPKRKRINKRLLFRVPKAPPRKDANKGHVVINETKNDKIKEHMVSDLPFPFNSVKDYEATVRAPIGRTWLPETAHQKLIAPPVVTKLGTVINPMDEGELLRREDYKED